MCEVFVVASQCGGFGMLQARYLLILVSEDLSLLRGFEGNFGGSEGASSDWGLIHLLRQVKNVVLTLLSQ
jgi:hypothetical protein